MRNAQNKNFKKVIYFGLVCLLAAAGSVFTLSKVARAGNAFFPAVAVYINSGGIKAVGQANSENSLATAISYRSGIVGLSGVTDQPGPHRIFAADGTYPAYTTWDIGSSVWSPVAQAAGQDMYEVLETYAGLNGWTGPSYVGGSHKILTLQDISETFPIPPDVVMEPIPVPVLAGSLPTAVTLQFAGLKDRSDVAPAGTWNDSIVSYTLYRSSNTTSTPVKIAVLPQPAGGGGTVSYTDSTLTQGVNYFYQVSVNFRWAANSPNPWYETVAKGPWSSALFTGQPSDSVKFMAGPITANSIVAAGPITVTSYNFASGDVGNVAVPVTLNLTSNSGGSPQFFSYTGSACGSVPITSVTLAAGTSSISFCYSDSKAGSWNVTAAPTNGWNPITQAGQIITVGPLDHFDANFSASQKNGVAFTGTNTVAARDAGGNLISNFNTQNITAVITANNTATLTQNSLLSSDFVNGTANVTSKNFIYQGTAGSVLFTVTSSTGKIGTSTVIISPGLLTSIKIRDAVLGGGNVISTHSMTTDNTYTMYAAGYDSSNNYISDTAGTWAVTGNLDNTFIGGGSTVIFTPSHGPTSGTVTFNDGSGHAASTGTITVNPGALASFSLPQNIGDQTSGVNFNIGPIKALDSKGNVVTAFSATVNFTDTTGTITPAISGSFINGQLPLQLVNVTKAQSGVKITATDTGSGKSGNSNNFTVSHGQLHHFSINSPAAQVNDKTFTGINTVTAQDQWNNILTDYNSVGSAVTLSVSNGGSLQNNILQAGDFASGVANLTSKNFKYTGSSGSILFTATGASKSGTVSVNINPGDVASVIIRSGSNNTGTEQGAFNMEVGQNLVLFAAGYDISGNFIGDIKGNFGRTGTLDAPLSGLINSINYQPVTAYTSGTITFDDGAGHTDSTGTITVNRGPLDHFQLNFTSPQNDGIGFIGTNTVVAKDVGNNTITDYNIIGTAVTLTASGTGSTLANNVLSKNDFSAGIASLTAKGFSYTGLVGNVTLTAAAATSGKTGSGSVTINVGALHHFDVSLSPTQLINTPFTGTNIITAKDIGNNTITGFNALVDNVTITASPSGSVTPYGLGGPTGNMLALSSDFVNGEANVAGKLTHPGPGGSYIFTATSSSGKKGDSGTVEIDVGPLHHFEFEPIAGQRAGQPFNVKVIAYAQDPQGNNHVKAAYSGAVKLTDSSGTVNPTGIGPFVNGQATVSLSVTKAMAGNILHVSDIATPTITGDSNAFDVSNGVLDHFALSQSIGNQIAGTDFDIGRIEARDRWDNIVTDFGSPVVISDSAKTLTPSSTPAFTGGVLVGQTVNITKIKTSDIITVSYQGNQGISNAFNVNPGSLASVVISDQAGGAGPAIANRLLSVDDTLTLYAVGYDLYGNYINEVAGSWGATGNLDSPVSGSHSSIIYAPTHAAATGTLTFNDGSGHTAFTGTVTTKHGALANFGFSVGTSQQVGVALSAPSTLTALDGKDNTVLDFNASVDNVTFTASTGGTILGLGAGSNNILNTAPSFINGVADLHDLKFIYAGKSGAVTLQATSASGKGGTSAPVNFVPGPLDHFNVNFGGVQKNGVAFTSGSIITAVDMGNNTLPTFDAAADPITFAVSPSDGVVSGLSGGNILNNTSNFVSGVAAVAGKLIFTGKTGPHIFTLTSESGKTGSSAQIEITPGILDHLQIHNAPEGSGGIIGNQTLNAGDTLSLYAAGYDKSDNFIQDQTVSWVGTGAVSTFLNPVNGSNTTLNAMAPGTGTVFASIGNIQAQTGTITIKAGSPAKLVFLTAPYDGGFSPLPPPPHSNNAPLVVGKSSGPITVQIQDVVGNVVTASAGLPFSLSTSGSGVFSESSSSWSAVTSSVISKGESQTTVYFLDNISGTYSITLTPSAGQISPVTQNIIVNPVYNNSLVFTTERQSVKAGEVSGLISVQLEDSDGNAATSTDVINVKLSSNSPGAPKFYFDRDRSAEITSLNLPVGKSSVVFYYSDTQAGPALLHAQAQGVTDGYQLITVNSAAPAKLFIKPGPRAQDGQNIIQNFASDKISVQLFDNFGNPVPATGDIPVHLSSANASSGSFAGDGTNGNWLLGSDNPVAVIHSGSSEASFYYRDSALGQVTITATAMPENNLTSASQIETIYAPVISRLAFITPPRKTDTNVQSSIITVQTQDALGNAIAVSADTNIMLLTSDTAGGSFALSAAGPWNVTQVVVLSGQSSASFYYKDTTPGTKNLGVSETPSLGWADAVQPIVINAGLPAKLAFISAPQTIGKNSASGAMIVQLQDSQGYPTVYGSDLTISLRTDSAGGSFTGNAGSGPWGLGSVTLSASSSQTVFYYRDQLPGTYTLSAQAAGHAGWAASQLIAVTEGIIHQVSFISVPQSLQANAASGVISIQTQNDQGDPVNVSADTAFTLSSTSGSGQFAASTSSPWGITQVIILAGTSKVNFYYKDSAAGTFILSAAENPSKGWTDAQQQIIVGSVEKTITKLVFTSLPQVGNNSISGGEISSKISVQTRSVLDNVVSVPSLTYVVIDSSSPTARFATSPGGPFSNSLVLSLQAGQSGADFYYTDTILGVATLTAAEFPSIGWAPATQPIEIKAGKITQLAFLTAAQSALKGVVSGVITLQSRDVYGNAKAPDSDTVINLSSTSGSGEFYQSNDGSNAAISTLTLKSGSSSASFYYKDNAPGSYQLKADEAQDQNWVAAFQSMTVTEALVSNLVIQPNFALLPTGTNVQLTAVGYSSSGQAIPDLQIDWQVVNPAAGSISADGILTTADSVGNYSQVIKATSKGTTAFATVEVYSKPEGGNGGSTPSTVSSGNSGGNAVVIKVPSQPPVNALLAINDGASETIAQKVALSLYATGASYMKISEDPAFGNAATWLPYNTAENFTLSSGFGKKTVYAKYQSASGDESAVTSATINFVEKLSQPSAGNGQTGSYINNIVKNYNYIILHQQNGQAPQLPVVISPTSNSFVLQNDLTITGVATPNTIVTLHIHSSAEVNVKVVTDSTGAFVYKLDETKLDAGSHQIYASIDEASGSLVGPPVEFALLARPQAAEAPQILINIGLLFSKSTWLWLLGIWLLFMIIIFFGLDRLIVYAKATNRFNFGFLSRWSAWKIMSLLGGIALIVFLGLGELAWQVGKIAYKITNTPGIPITQNASPNKATTSPAATLSAQPTTIPGAVINSASTTKETNKVLGNITVQATVTGALNVRISPSAAGNILAKIKAGETYPYITLQNGWYQIVLASGKTGWVSSDFVSK